MQYKALAIEFDALFFVFKLQDSVKPVFDRNSVVASLWFKGNAVKIEDKKNTFSLFITKNLKTTLVSMFTFSRAVS